LKVIKTEIAGLLVIEPDIFNDDRGFFFESYSKQRYEKFGVSDDIVQDNISKSNRGTVRGLHYQVGEKAQGQTLPGVRRRST
jgi:dTDP-4-dehydrorhamnose 3,5-epimerase